MKIEQDGEFYVLRMETATIYSKRKDYIENEYRSRKEKCYCNEKIEKCGYCTGVENPHKVSYVRIS